MAQAPSVEMSSKGSLVKLGRWRVRSLTTLIAGQGTPRQQEQQQWQQQQPHLGSPLVTSPVHGPQAADGQGME